MPHDKRGNVVAEGDAVLIRGKVKTVTPGETFCNVVVELDERQLTDAGPAGYPTTLTLNAHQLERVDPELQAAAPTDAAPEPPPAS